MSAPVPLLRTLPSDPERRIHLPGVGDVERPVDIDRRHTGFDRLLSLRIYHFRQDQIIDGEAEGDEVCVVFVHGGATFEVVDPKGARRSWRIAGRADPFEGAAEAIYLPPHHSYRLTPDGDALVAYARAAARGDLPARRIAPADGVLLAPGEAERLICRQAVATPGSWLLPPTPDDPLPYETIAYHRIDGDGRAAALAHIRGRGDEEVAIVRDGDALAIRSGSLAVVAPPEERLYILQIGVAGPDAAEGA